MPPVQPHQDDCLTAADVIARAHQVVRKRQQFFHRPQERIVERLIIREIDPPMQVMFEKISAAHGITADQLSDAIELIRASDGAKQRPQPRISDIQRSVAAAGGLRTADLTGMSREKSIVRPRHIAMALASNLTKKSLPEIGRSFGRDHTSVLYAVRKLAPLSLFVTENIRPFADLSEWTTMMFRHYGELVS